jgi:hypothetical protein
LVEKNEPKKNEPKKDDQISETIREVEPKEIIIPIEPEPEPIKEEPIKEDAKEEPVKRLRPKPPIRKKIDPSEKDAHKEAMRDKFMNKLCNSKKLKTSENMIEEINQTLETVEHDEGKLKAMEKETKKKLKILKNSKMFINKQEVE